MKKLTVKLTRNPEVSLVVGQLASEGRRTYFEYDPDFIETGLQLSSFRLPLHPELIEHTDHQFGPLPGLFDDSLPDGWGLLLMDRHFRNQGLDPVTISPLDRLTYLGTRTMGALTYHPPAEIEADRRQLDLHALGKNAEEVLEGEVAEVLPQLMKAGGSPGGARPKILVGISGDKIISGEDDLPEDFDPWIIKFAAKRDARDAGSTEYAYALMAREAGIDMPEVRLFEVRGSRRYFGIKRFDRRPGNSRVHMHTFGNMIHSNFRIPSADYADLLKVTRALTRNHRDVVRAFRRMVFNIAAHNRDDHVKNFAFIMDELGQWSLSPAYDMTYAAGPGGEHTMTIMGEGRTPTRDHCLKLAGQFGIVQRDAMAVIQQVNAAVAHWPRFAEQAQCSKAAFNTIKRTLIAV
jgi:serine/threonine-protein kinase HipA